MPEIYFPHLDWSPQRSEYVRSASSQFLS